jgi:hypothetical protein
MHEIPLQWATTTVEARAFQATNQKQLNGKQNMKATQKTLPASSSTIRGRRLSKSLLRFGSLVATLALGAFHASAQAFGSTELKTGISNSLAVIMLFGFVLGIAAVISGGFAIRRGDVDTGKLSIIGGAVIAAAPAIAFAFFKIFGLDASSTVGVGGF